MDIPKIAVDDLVAKIRWWDLKCSLCLKVPFIGRIQTHRERFDEWW